MFPCGYVNLICSQLDLIFHIWIPSLDPNTHLYWYFAIGLAVLFIPLCFIRDISYFSKLHILGDIAVLSTVITLSVTAIQVLSGDEQVGNKIHAISSGWGVTLGMVVTMLEGVSLILPIKVYILT